MGAEHVHAALSRARALCPTRLRHDRRTPLGDGARAFGVKAATTAAQATVIVATTTTRDNSGAASGTARMTALAATTGAGRSTARETIRAWSAHTRARKPAGRARTLGRQGDGQLADDQPRERREQRRV